MQHGGLTVEGLVGVREVYERLWENVRGVIAGKDGVVDLALVSLLAGGHLLLTDIPGVGKTTLARAIAASIDADFGRIQFTPDLLPSDITGSSVFDPRQASFEWIAGPIFAPVLSADEINRATPLAPRARCSKRWPRARLRWTVYRVRYRSRSSWWRRRTRTSSTVPIHLPEGQLDRFMVATSMGYPDLRAELRIVCSQVERRPLEEIEPVVGVREVCDAREIVRGVQVHEEILAYAVGISEASREHPVVSLGVSPRGSIALIRAARAATQGRDFVGPEDVKALAPSTLSHRISVRARRSTRAGRRRCWKSRG